MVAPTDFIVLGHRGLAQHAPENTLAGFKVAKDNGLTWVEFDIQLTKDGIWVLFHDDDTQRVAQTKEPLTIAGLTLAQVKTLDVGSYFSPQFTGTKIPTLAETLSTCAELGLNVNVEIKLNAKMPEFALQDLLKQSSEFQKKHLLCFSSFCHETLEQVRTLDKTTSIGVLCDTFTPEVLETVKKLSPATLNTDHTTLDPTLIPQLTKQVPVLLYTVNDPQKAQQYKAQGVMGIFTDRIEIAKALLP